MNHAPSEILLAWLRAGNHVTAPQQVEEFAQNWPGFRAIMPDVPDRCLAIYDTEGNRDGRLSGSGEVILHPTINVRVRCVDYDEGWRKAYSVAIALDAIVNDATVILTNPGAATTTTYRVRAVSRTGGILHNGLETATAPSTKRRHIFTFNCQLTIN